MDPFKVHEKLLKNYLYEETIPFLKRAWKEPHRKYHNIDHLKSIIEFIDKNRFYLNPFEYDAAILAAFFHDAYYQPRDSKKDKDESIKRFLSSFKHQNRDIRNAVVALIEATKYRKKPIQKLIRFFWDADNNGFNLGYEHICQIESKIREEYNHLPNSVYKKKRIEFLKSNLGIFGKKADEDINKLIRYISDKYQK